MNLIYFSLKLFILEEITFLYNRHVAAMLSMHPICSGRSSTIENKLKIGGGGGIRQKINKSGKILFPVACLNQPKNLKSVYSDNKENKISESLEDLKNKENNLKLYFKILNSLKNEFQVKIGVARNYTNNQINKMSSEDFSEFNSNLIKVSSFLMTLSNEEKNLTKNLKNASDLLIALYECEKIFTVIPTVLKVEMVIKKFEEEEKTVNPLNLLEYFTLKEIKIPLWDLLQIRKADDSIDIKIENLNSLIHKTDKFLEENRVNFIEENALFFNKIIFCIDKAAIVLECTKNILKKVKNFNDEKWTHGSPLILKSLSDSERHDLVEKSNVLKILSKNDFPEEEIEIY
ncbi:putative esophageal gland cell secretory protein 17 [Meloidogyne graminicola]|uniref:Putative esophageal gland cell secretory protein 17 n=1 Tax=Meloidogyne graminicola TaxID=189291 RepID=A0A8S9ZGS6_9BILA|nr:putative esophageal gland cell secretory protein 17 [Meloidogyne graminicola]